MFGRDPRIPLNDLLRPRIRYLGSDETILSLQAMRNIYKMVAHNLKTARKRLEKEATKFPTRVKTEDLIMLKRHDKKTFEPVYEGYYHVIQIRGNQVDVQSTTENQTKTVQIKDVKVVLPVDRVINEMPDYTKFGRKSKLDPRLEMGIIDQIKYTDNTHCNNQFTITNGGEHNGQNVCGTYNRYYKHYTLINLTSRKKRRKCHGIFGNKWLNKKDKMIPH